MGVCVYTNSSNCTHKISTGFFFVNQLKLNKAIKIKRRCVANEVIKMIKRNSKIYSIQKKSEIENELTNKSGTKQNNQQNSNLQTNCSNN